MKTLVLLLMVLLVSCATTSKINGVSLGMNKAQVIAVMGAPNSTSATKGVEYMNYDLYATPDAAFQGFSIPYYVRLVNGKVDAYGKQGDFQN